MLAGNVDVCWLTCVIPVGSGQVLTGGPVLTAQVCSNEPATQCGGSHDTPFIGLSPIGTERWHIWAYNCYKQVLVHCDSRRHFQWATPSPINEPRQFLPINHVMFRQWSTVQSTLYYSWASKLSLEWLKFSYCYCYLFLIFRGTHHALCPYIHLKSLSKLL